MSEGIERDDDKSREELEREAERARARLLSTLDVLDRRRHDLLDVKTRVEEHAVPLAIGAALVVLTLGGAVGVMIHHFVERRRHKGRERLRALARIWRHPERAMRTEERSVVGEVARKMLLSALSVAASQIASHTVKYVLDAQDQHEGAVRKLPRLAQLAEQYLRPKPEAH